MKRFVSISLCLALFAISFVGCSGKKSAVLTIGQAEVDNEVFAYFFDEVCSKTESEGGNLLDTQPLIDAAVDKCGEYVSAVTMFERLSLALTADEKKSISTLTEDEWLLYGSYYSNAGISKQTVAKITQAEQMRTALLLYYFGEGREYEVSEEEIEYYFDQTYVQFQAINGYLTTVDEDGNTIPLTEEEAAALRTDFESKKQKIEAGSSLAEVNDGNEVDSTFIAVANTAYPQGFLEQVGQLEYNKPAVIETDDYIFLVVRQDAKAGDENNYKSYRTNYIEALRGEMLTEMLVATTEDYGVERDADKLQKIAQDVIDARNSRK